MDGNSFGEREELLGLRTIGALIGQAQLSLKNAHILLADAQYSVSSHPSQECDTQKQLASYILNRTLMEIEVLIGALTVVKEPLN